MMEKYVTIEEASVALRVSTATLRRIVKRGDVPSYKFGKRVLFDPEEIKLYCRKKNS